MDSITHILLGYALSQSELIAESKSATACIILASIAPDIDLVFRARGVEKYFFHHRRESHSLFGLFLLSLGLLVLGKYTCPSLGWAKIYLFSWLGLLSHLLLDFLTSYGTPLFFPFKKRFYNLALLFILDPWLDLILVFALAGRWLFSSPSLPARISLLAGAGYLLILAWAKQQAKNQAKTLLTKPGLSLEKISAYPYFAHPFRWLILGKKGKEIYRLTISLAGKSSPLSCFFSQIPEEIMKEAQSHPLAGAMMNFSDYLYWKYFSREEEKILQIYDLRYSQYGMGFCAQLVWNQKGELVKSQFRYY